MIFSIYVEFLVSYKPKNKIVDDYQFDVEFKEIQKTTMHG
jgi:hypothetical protein